MTKSLVVSADSCLVCICITQSKSKIIAKIDKDFLNCIKRYFVARFLKFKVFKVYFLFLYFRANNILLKVGSINEMFRMPFLIEDLPFSLTSELEFSNRKIRTRTCLSEAYILRNMNILSRSLEQLVHLEWNGTHKQNRIVSLNTSLLQFSFK